MNSQYYLEIENKQFASIKGNVVEGVHQGETFVIVRDKNVPHSLDDKSSKTAMPRARIHVCQPVKIALSLLPHNNWITVEGEQHEIAIDLIAKNEQRITLGSKYSLQSTFDASMFGETKRNKNGSRIAGNCLLAGSNPVQASFEKVRNYKITSK